MCLPRSLARLCLSPYPDPLNYISTTNKPAVQGKSIDAAAASAAAEASALHIVDRPSPDSRARSLSGPELFTGFPTAHRFGRMYAAVLMRSVKSLNSKMNSVASATGGVFVCIYEQLCRVLYKKRSTLPHTHDRVYLFDAVHIIPLQIYLSFGRYAE